MRERDQSLAAQMDTLSKKQAIRDKRRMEQRMRSAADREDNDGGRAPSSAHDRAPANSTGGLATGRSAAEAVAEAARLSQSVTVYRCDVCQVTYKVESQYHMHMASATHRKAIAKLEEDRLRAMRGGAAAEAAMAAAGWNGRQGQAEVSYEAQGGGGGSWGGDGRQQQQHSRGGGRQQAQRGRGGRNGGPQSEPQRPVRTHADVVKELEKTREKGPLDLDGWVPPSVDAPFDYAKPEPVPRSAVKREVKDEAVKDEDVKGEDADEEVGPISVKAEDGVKEEEEEGGNALAGMLGGYGEEEEDDDSESGSSDDDAAEVPEGTSFF